LPLEFSVFKEQILIVCTKTSLDLLIFVRKAFLMSTNKMTALIINTLHSS